MKRLKFLSILALSSFGLCFGSTDYQVINQKECFIDFPHKSEFKKHWQLAFDQAEDINEKIKEWTPKEELLTQTNNEAFTIQAYQLDDSFKLKDVYQKFIDTLEESVQEEGLISTNIKHEDDDSLYFEWWINEPSQKPEHEWVKLMKNKYNQLVFVRFATQKEALNQDDLIWTTCIEEAKLINSEKSKLDPALKDLQQLF